MKKKIVSICFCILGIAAAVLYYSKNDGVNSDLLPLTSIEALAGCEITKSNGSVIFSCSGENTCSETYLGRTLTCDGTKN